MMEETKTTEARKFSFWPFFMWPMAVLVLYVLSVGPVMLMVDKNLVSGKALKIMNTCYAPLDWAYDNDLLHKPLGMYLHLWSKRFDKNGGSK